MRRTSHISLQLIETFKHFKHICYRPPNIALLESIVECRCVPYNAIKLKSMCDNEIVSVHRRHAFNPTWQIFWKQSYQFVRFVLTRFAVMLKQLWECYLPLTATLWAYVGVCACICVCMCVCFEIVGRRNVFFLLCYCLQCIFPRVKVARVSFMSHIMHISSSVCQAIQFQFNYYIDSCKPLWCGYIGLEHHQNIKDINIENAQKTGG